jgi:glucose/arabinose dehydrogenase
VRCRALWCVPLALLTVACASDGGSPSDEDSSAVIVTTTTPDPSPDIAVSPPDTSATASTETVTSAVTTTAGTPTDATPPVEPTEPPPPPTSQPPVVGDPRVTATEVGRFDQPVDLVTRPGDEALYVVQQRGQVVRWLRDGDDRRIVLDVAERLSGGNEQGLLGLAFSPDGATAYVDFTATDGTTTIAEYPVAADGSFDSAAERIVLTVPQPYGNHNAGDLHVDDDGLLYVTLGDGGSGGDPQRVANDPTSLLGSLLRIDPRIGADSSGDRAYSIPPDNPFADGPLTLDDGTTIDGAPEVFAWGLRNPWKLAFDPVTGELWIPDVGQNEVEEINVVGPTGDRPAGWAHDFGWSAFEGTDRFNTDVPDTGRATSPVLTYRHGAGGCSVSGGVPYRGSAIPELAPAFVYSDYCSGIVWALDLAGVRNLVLLDGFEGVTAIRADAAGELYVLEAGGAISQLVPG